MNLSNVIQSARSALDVASAQTAVVSRNIANAGDDSQARKIAQISTQQYGARLVTIDRAESPALRAQMQSAQSQNGSDAAYLDGLQQLRTLLGGEDYDASPAAKLSQFNIALETYANDPSNVLMAENAVTQAKDIAASIREGAASIGKVRNETDRAILTSVERVNSLLQEFEVANGRVIAATQKGLDATDALDARDQLVQQLSEKMGISTVTRGNNDMMLHTDSGVVLFETRPRGVTFQPSNILGSDVLGNQIFVDGVAVTGANATMEISSGSLQGMVAFRDGPANAMQRQYDEMARGLIATFAESDRSGAPVLPDIPGLFTASGLTALPADGVLVPNLALTLQVATSVDPAKGGNALLLRDGGIGAPGDPAYKANTNNAAGFSVRLSEMMRAVTEPRNFDAATGMPASGSIFDATQSSIGWLEQTRQTSDAKAGFSSALLQRSTDLLSSQTGVNLDTEMTRLLDLERSYSASARLISAVDSMFADLLAAIR